MRCKPMQVLSGLFLLGVLLGPRKAALATALDLSIPPYISFTYDAVNTSRDFDGDGTNDLVASTRFDDETVVSERSEAR